MEKYYSFVTFVTVCTSLIMLVMSVGNSVIPRRQKSFFVALFLGIAVASICEWAGYLLSGTGPQVAPFLTLLKTTEFSLAPFLSILYSAAIRPGDASLRIVALLAGVHALFEWILAPFGVVFYVDGNGGYHHGSAYLLYILAYVASVAYLLDSVRVFAKSFQYRNQFLPWLVLVFMAVCVVVQMLDSEVRIVWLALAISATMFYIFYCSVVQQTDALTRLLNRYSFDALLAGLKNKATLLLFDVDNFKAVNDTFGHASGDECLRCVGRALCQVFGPYGSCYRTGGDEFCVLVTNKRADVRALEGRFEKMLGGLRAQHDYISTISVGESELDPSSGNVADAYRRADEMMYDRKRQRKEQGLASLR